VWLRGEHISEVSQVPAGPRIRTIGDLYVQIH
jgi:hypothetical protein